jgi:hypothetical protein
VASDLNAIAIGKVVIQGKGIHTGALYGCIDRILTHGIHLLVIGVEAAAIELVLQLADVIDIPQLHGVASRTGAGQRSAISGALSKAPIGIDHGCVNCQAGKSQQTDQSQNEQDNHLPSSCNPCASHCPS